MTLVWRPGYTWNETIWNPSMIGPLMWFDADDSSTITLNGSNVSEWRDKSGNNLHASQSSTSLQPAYTVAGLNGKNLLTSPGGKRLILPNQTISDSTTFAVANDTRNSNYGVLLILTNTGGAKPHSFLVNADTGSPLRWGSYLDGNRLANSDIDTNFAIASIESNSTNLIFHKNGSADGTASSSFSSNPFTSSFIFSDQYGSSLQGNIAEIVFFDALLSAADRQKMEGYLAHKWGLTANLSNDHPYKLLGPTP